MVSPFLIAVGCRSEEASEVWELKIYFLTSALLSTESWPYSVELKGFSSSFYFLIEQLRSMG